MNRPPANKLKGEWRQIFLRRRRELPPEIIRDWSMRIAERLLAFPLFYRASVVMFYLAMADEPQTDIMINAALRQGKTVCVPRLRREYGLMDAVRITGLDSLRPGRFGLSEPPPENEVVSPERIELVTVPGVVFDCQGGRIGFGAGYYDRFLAAASRAVRVGVCWSVQVADKPIEREPHDILMEYLLTEKSLKPCRP